MAFYCASRNRGFDGLTPGPGEKLGENFSDIIIGIIGRDKAETFVRVEMRDRADPHVALVLDVSGRMAVPGAGAVVGGRVRNVFAARNWRGPRQGDVVGHFRRMVLVPFVVPRSPVVDSLSFPEGLAVHHVLDVHENFSDIIFGIIRRDEAETFVHVSMLKRLTLPTLVPDMSGAACFTVP